ncbi:undecaprenyl-diphosphate phosphatase [Limisalsivibrio acetivorans]|uniref:undecaprenyl-diphosphate phosphatase n=1 Tax=Limisalsivibrio acetivorans TaxID=1304888 RepID=UPI0003B5D48D|nr:undecaprenyl-diphosphate phosphatase [Limisalsivibrio acetivorans]
MGVLTAALLGLLQGLTEFLPVSSSGHLVLAQSLMRDFEQPGLLFDTMLHLATLFAVLLYFREKVRVLVLSLLGIFSQEYKVMYFENKRFLWGIIIASIPTAVVGLGLESTVEGMFATPSYVGYFLILTSVLLVLSDKVRTVGEIDGPRSFLIGIVQGFAVIPGISRSGSTVAAGLFLGIKREEMAEFSFLMSVPAIFGAAILQIRHLKDVPFEHLPAYGVGMLAAFISGFIAIGFMVFFIKRASLTIFAIYCLVVGITAIVWM